MLPVVGLYQRMSLLPSWLKSPIPAGRHAVSCGPRLTLAPQYPFESSHASVSPVVALYQSRSLVPSLLKSPVPAGSHAAACGPMSTLAIQCVCGGTGHRRA